MPQSEAVQGRSLLPVIEGVPANTPAIAFAESIKRTPDQKAVYFGKWKLRYRMNRNGSELYNLADDPGETNNLAGANPDMLKMLHNLLNKQMRENRELAKEIELQRVGISQQQLDDLEALGYVNGESETDESEVQEGTAREVEKEQ